MQLLPKAWMPFVKSWLSLIGVAVSVVVTAVPEAPRWVTIVGAVVASVGVYFGVNTDPNAPAGKHAADVTELPGGGTHTP